MTLRTAGTAAPPLGGAKLRRRGVLRVAGAGIAGLGAITALGPAGVALAAPAAQAGSEIRLNLGSEPDTIDPNKSSFTHEIAVIMRTWANLLRFERGQLVLDQAADWPIVDNDGRTVTITLKDGLKYADGRALTAFDFEYGWKRHFDPAVQGEYASIAFVIAGSEEYYTTKETDPRSLNLLRDSVGVRALDDRTLQIQLRNSAAWFLSLLGTWVGMPVRQDMVQQGGERWTEPESYIGNGPYRLVKWDHDTEIVLSANPNYDRGAPPVETIRLAMIKEHAVEFAAYLAGELDVVGVVREDLPRIQGDPDLRAQWTRYPGLTTFWLIMHWQKAPFTNKLVRQAFSAAVDRVSWVRDILGGIGVAARQLVPPDVPGHYEDIEPQVFNPTIARALLTEARFPGGRGLPPVKYTHSATALAKARGEALVEQFKRNLGIDIPLEPLEPRAMVAARKKPETAPQLYIGGWHQDYPDPQNWYSELFRSKSGNNETGWTNTDFDTLVEQADVHPDSDARNALYRQAGAILNEESPVAFMWHTIESFLVKPIIRGYRPDPADWYFAQSTIYDLRISR